MRIIKKYDNRKLYDTKLKKYTTLKGLVQLINSGKEFTVLNAEQENITNEVLKQAVTKINIDSSALIDVIYDSQFNGQGS